MLTARVALRGGGPMVGRFALVSRLALRAPQSLITPKPPSWIIGPMGQGKTALISSMVQEALKSGYSVCGRREYTMTDGILNLNLNPGRTQPVEERSPHGMLLYEHLRERLPYFVANMAGTPPDDDDAAHGGLTSLHIALLVAGCVGAVVASGARTGHCGKVEAPGWVSCPVCGNDDEELSPVRHHWHQQPAGYFADLKKVWKKRVIPLIEQGTHHTLLDVCHSCNTSHMGVLAAEPDMLSLTGRTVFFLQYSGRAPFEYVMPGAGPCCDGGPETTAALKFQVLSNPASFPHGFGNEVFDGAARSPIALVDFKDYELFVDVANHRAFWSQTAKERRQRLTEGASPLDPQATPMAIQVWESRRRPCCASPGTATVPQYTPSLLKHALEKGFAYFRHVVEGNDPGDGDDEDDDANPPGVLQEVLACKVNDAYASGGWGGGYIDGGFRQLSDDMSQLLYECRYEAEAESKWYGDKQIVLNATHSSSPVPSLNALLRWQESHAIPLTSTQVLCPCCGVCLRIGLKLLSETAQIERLTQSVEKHLRGCRFNGHTQARDDGSSRANAPSSPASSSRPSPSSATPRTGAAAPSRDIELGLLTEGDNLIVACDSRPISEPALLQRALTQSHRIVLSKRKRGGKSFTDFSDATTQMSQRAVTAYLASLQKKTVPIKSLQELSKEDVVKELEAEELTEQEALMAGVLGLVRGVDGDAGPFSYVTPDGAWFDRDDEQAAWNEHTILAKAPDLEVSTEPGKESDIIAPNGDATRYFRNSILARDWLAGKRAMAASKASRDDYFGARPGVLVNSQVSVLSPCVIDHNGLTKKDGRCQVILSATTLPNDDAGIYLSDIGEEPYPSKRFCWAEMSRACLKAPNVRMAMRTGEAAGAGSTAGAGPSNFDALLSASETALAQEQ